MSEDEARIMPLQMENETIDAQIAAARKRGKHARKLSKGVRSLRCVRLLAGHPENIPPYIKQIPGLSFKDHYVILGEVEGIKHYIVLNMRTGKVLPGMFHIDRFERVPEDDL